MSTNALCKRRLPSLAMRSCEPFVGTHPPRLAVAESAPSEISYDPSGPGYGHGPPVPLRAARVDTACATSPIADMLLPFPWPVDHIPDAGTMAPSGIF